MWLGVNLITTHDPMFVCPPLTWLRLGILIESKGPTWLWATASEHNVLYQYALSNAEFVFLGLVSASYQRFPV